MSKKGKSKKAPKAVNIKQQFLDEAPQTMKMSRLATMDGFDNFISRLGLNNDNALSAGTYEFNLITRNRIKLEAAYRGSWIVGKVVDCFAEDMTKAGIDFTTSESKQDPEELKRAISRLGIAESLCDSEKWGRLYGAAIGVYQIEGQDLATPLDIDTVDKGQFKGIVVYDRWQLNPDLTDVIATGNEIGLPKYYDIVNNPTQTLPSSKTQTGQLRVHHSRLFRNIGIKLPYFQAITEMMWGESILERLWDRLIAFDNVTMSSASLVDRANLRTVGIDGLREIVAAGGEAMNGLLAQFEMMRSMQVNEGLTLLDKNDVFAATAYSFAGLSDMMLQFNQQVSGACDTPLVRLFGQSPAGFNSTGEGDLRMYYDSVLAKQESKFRGPWDTILKIMWRSVYGESAPDDLTFQFVPLWQMTDMDRSTIAKNNTETIIEAENAGLIPKDKAMKELKENSSETGLFSSITDEDIADAEEDLPPMPELSNGEIDPTEEGQAPVAPIKPSIKQAPAQSKDAKWSAKIKKLLGR